MTDEDFDKNKELNIPSFEDYIRQSQSIGRNTRTIAQRPPGDRVYIIDHVSMIDHRDPAGQRTMYNDRLFDMLQRMRNDIPDFLIETEEEKAEKAQQVRLKKINQLFRDKIQGKICYTEKGITIDGELMDNVGAATVLGNLIIASMNESVEEVDFLNEKVNDFFKL